MPCKQMETKTFSNEEVRRELSRFVLLRIDCSESTPENEKLKQSINRRRCRRCWCMTEPASGPPGCAVTPPETLLPILLKTP